MNALENSSPLLIPTVKFNSIDEYFLSLSKSSRSDLKRCLHRNQGLNYEQTTYNYDECKYFMDVWSNCNGHNWGNWYSKEELQDLHNRGILKCFKSNDIAYHFVLKWGQYIYCNAPLYDKTVYKEIEIGKWMWVKLIQYCLRNKWVDYIDLMGPENICSFGEVIKNKTNVSDKGDFGYKWKFVPERIKNQSCKSFNHIKTVSDKVFIWKGLETPPKPKKLLVIAHPDDEAIFFGDWLLKNGNKVKVVCLSCSNEEVRFNEFQNCLKRAGVNYSECFDNEPSQDLFKKEPEIIKNLERIKKETDWEEVVTHNIYGEYGHIQHIQTHEIVRKIFNKDKIFVYYNSNQKSDNSHKQILLEKYPSQKQFCIDEIKQSLCTGSDWYKHTLNKNMIEYESVIKLSSFKNQLNINLIWTEGKDHVLFDIIKGIFREFLNRNHTVAIIEDFKLIPINKEDVNITFNKKDSQWCVDNGLDYFFVINDEMMIVKNSYNQYHHLINESIKSFVKTREIRDKLGDRINLVWLPLLRNWKVFIRKFEAHLYMGLVSQDKIKTAKAE